VDAKVKVKVQNRSVHDETIADLPTYMGLVALAATPVAPCPAPTIALNLDKAPEFPRVLKSKASMTVSFLVTINCANDAEAGAGHEDFSLSAQVNHSVLGTGDAHTADDSCPRTVPPGGIIDAFPNGKLIDKGCGSKNADKTFGAPVLIDVTVD
jgi:hypothetical protein